MARNHSAPMVQEAVGVFFGVDNLQRAIEELVESGFDRSEIGLLAGADTVQEALGDFYVRTNEFSNSPNAPCMAFANKIEDDTFHALLGALFFYGATSAAGAAVASAAVLGGAAIAAASGVAAIGFAGAVMGLIIHKTDADFLDEQVDAGHLVLFVRTRDSERAERAVNVLSRHCAYAPKVYTIPACR